MSENYDVVVVGSGPNGLTAAARIAQAGFSVLVLESSSVPGGGARTAELTLPGFRHDVCSAVHPTGFLSPAFRSLQLEKFGLEWVLPEYSVAHPLDGQDSVLLKKSIDETADGLAKDGGAYRRLLSPLFPRFEELVGQLFNPFELKKDYWGHVLFGMRGLPSASALSKVVFSGTRAKALWAGCAAHSVLPLSNLGTSAVALVFLLSGHVAPWPVARGGSSSITEALLRLCAQRGVDVRVDTPVKHLEDLPVASRYLFDLSPKQLLQICGHRFGNRYQRALKAYDYGPGVCKVDYALSSPIPWRDGRCLEASTVHVGGTFEEIATSELAAWRGLEVERPFVMVCQQSQFDDTRAPAGRHTGYAYCHVPNGSSRSASEQIENQIERFAPGFRDCILERRVMTAQGFEAYNPSYVGGAITGGAAKISQLFARPALRLNPYSTPDSSIYLCSHATPPGGGVHGMCGWNAAGAILKSFR